MQIIPRKIRMHLNPLYGQKLDSANRNFEKIEKRKTKCVGDKDISVKEYFTNI